MTTGSTRRLRAVALALAAGFLGVAAVALATPGCEEREYYNGTDGDLDLDVDVDVDSDTDTDSDGDGDGDADADADGEADPCDAPLDSCSAGSDCVLALNFRVCCPCPRALPGGVLCRDRLCILPAGPGVERPEGCNSRCDDVACEACEGTATGAACSESECVTVYVGACATDADCGDGEICELVAGASACVPDPNECEIDEDCPGAELCRDWRGEGFLTCWHPDSTCTSHDACDYNHFCEDGDGDGIYQCVDRSPACRPGHDGSDCPDGQRCADPDGDGYGDCVVGD